MTDFTPTKSDGRSPLVATMLLAITLGITTEVLLFAHQTFAAGVLSVLTGAATILHALTLRRHATAGGTTRAKRWTSISIVVCATFGVGAIVVGAILAAGIGV